MTLCFRRRVLMFKSVLLFLMVFMVLFFGVVTRRIPRGRRRKMVKFPFPLTSRRGLTKTDLRVIRVGPILLF